MPRHTARLTSLTLICSLVLLVACGTDQPPSTAVAYEGALVIVGDGTTVENATILVDNGQIVAVGPAAEVDVPSGVTRIDVAGRTIMPAIVDTHVHLSTTREALMTDLAVRASFGVGAVASMGSDTEDAPLALRTETIPRLARFRSAGTGITRPEPGRREVHWIDTEADGRRAVRDEVARGADLIKIWVDDRNGQFDALTPALYGAIIDEAHAHGLKVAAHIFSLEDARGLVTAGVDIFAHGVRDRDIDESFLQLVSEHPDLVLIPNLPGRGVPTDTTWLDGRIGGEQLAAVQAAEESPTAQEAFGIQARNLARLSTAGMTIALGTDGNTPWAPHVEMEDMVAAGMSPADVIIAATRNGAALLGFDDMGTIAEGKSADFIVLSANPLDDITNTRTIEAVILRGVEVDAGRFHES